MTSLRFHPARIINLFAQRRSRFYGKVYGSYELQDEVSLAADVINTINAPTSTILDVGANSGHYSSLLVNFLDTSSVIHCFEPSINHHEILSTLECKYEGQIYYHPFGLSSSDGTRTLFKNNQGSSFASLYNRDIAHHGLSLDYEESVSITTLDAWYDKSTVSRINFLKVDVEGHELEVFRGGSHVLSQGLVDALQFEFGGCNIDSRTYFKDFSSLLSGEYGFNLYRLAPAKRLVDMNTYNESFECFTWQNIVGFRCKSLIPAAYTIIYE